MKVKFLRKYSKYKISDIADINISENEKKYLLTSKTIIILEKNEEISAVSEEVENSDLIPTIIPNEVEDEEPDPIISDESKTEIKKGKGKKGRSDE